jgi:hypothetical protein
MRIKKQANWRQVRQSTVANRTPGASIMLRIAMLKLNVFFMLHMFISF